MVNVVVVGAGDHYRKSLRPSLDELQRQRHAQLIATVDIRAVEAAVRVPHLVRRPGQPLSELLRSFKAANPIVYLAHAHAWHARDTLDLAAAGFRVAIEKPYAISSEELGQLVKSLESSKVFLAEYYLMMKSTPLLHACKLLADDSFLYSEPGFLASGPAAGLIGPMTLTAVIGSVRYVYIDILEGQGETGRFEHRGVDFADRRFGGGSIMDLGVHAFTPLVALAPLIGDLDVSFQTVESAVAEAGHGDARIRP